MNKKFSTLVGCLLLGTAFSGVAQNQWQTTAYDRVLPHTPVAGNPMEYRSFGTKAVASITSSNQIKAIKADQWYQLAVGTIGEDTKVLVQERNYATGEIILRAVAVADAPLNASLWRIAYDKEDGKQGGKFSFFNKETGLGIVYDHSKGRSLTNEDAPINNTEVTTTIDGTILDGCNTEWFWYTSNVDNANPLAPTIIYADYHNSGNYMVLKLTSDNTANDKGFDITGQKVVAVVYSSADAGDRAKNVAGALKLTPVVANAVALGADDINCMIDAQKKGFASFKFYAPDGNLLNPTGMTPSANGTLGTTSYKAEKFEWNKLIEDYRTKINAEVIATAKQFVDEFAASPAEGTNLHGTGLDFGGGTWFTTNSLSDVTTTMDAFKAAQTDATKAKGFLDKVSDAFANATFKNVFDTDKKKAAYAELSELLTSTLNKEAIVAKAETDKAEFVKYPILLKVKDTKKNEYLMADTARWEEADKLPSNSPALKLANKTFAKDLTPFIDARFGFRLTYYPTQDSLLMEPLNASVMSDQEYSDGKPWKESIIASQFVKSTDLVSGGNAVEGLKISNTEFAGNNVQKPVAVMLNKLNTKDGWVVSAAATDKISGIPGTLHTRIGFGHTYTPYLERTTVAEEGIYKINLVTDLKPNLNTHRVNGNYLIADMDGSIVYKDKTLYENFDHMPATQWVIEYVGCAKPNNDKKARVKITNREYPDIVAFEGQLYKDGENVYFINHEWAGNNGDIAPCGDASKFVCTDTLKLTAITANELGYANLADKVIENTFKLQQFLGYGEDPYFLNVVKTSNDTILRAQKEGTDFELIPVSVSAKYTDKNGKEQTKTYTEIPYGYANTEVGASQLYKTVYMIKVKDADKINNDKKFIGYDPQGKYCMVDTLDKYPQKGEIAYFTLKESFHWTEESEDGHYYTLVQVEKPEIKASYNKEKDAVVVEWLSADLFKLAIKEGPLDAIQEGLCESHKDGFILTVDTMPYYRRLNSVAAYDTIKVYSVDNKNRVLFESVEETSNGNIVNYLGIHSVKENTANDALFVDTAWISNTSMPLYMFAVAPQFKQTRGCTHDDHPHNTGDHFYPRDYIQARYLINLDYTNIVPDYVKAEKHENVYTRLAFVNAIHMGDTLFILKGKDAAFELESDIKDPKNSVAQIILKKNTYQGVEIGFRLKDHTADTGEGNFDGDFYLEMAGKARGYAKDGNQWIKEQNHKMVITKNTNKEGEDHNGNGNQEVAEDIYQSMLFTLERGVDEAPVANEDIDASAISVVATDGAVIIKGAAGKTVSITNVLGQTIANTVLSSDEAKVSAPAGIVVVAVEGEAAVKAIVK